MVINDLGAHPVNVHDVELEHRLKRAWAKFGVSKQELTDKSVPITATYNHHYVASVIGGAAQYKKVQLSGPDDPRAADLMVGHGGLAWH